MLNGVLRSQNQKIFGASRHILVFQSLDHQNFKSGSLVHVTSRLPVAINSSWIGSDNTPALGWGITKRPTTT